MYKSKIVTFFILFFASALFLRAFAEQPQPNTPATPDHAAKTRDQAPAPKPTEADAGPSHVVALNNGRCIVPSNYDPRFLASQTEKKEALAKLDEIIAKQSRVIPTKGDCLNFLAHAPKPSSGFTEGSRLDKRYAPREDDSKPKRTPTLQERIDASSFDRLLKASFCYHQIQSVRDLTSNDLKFGDAGFFYSGEESEIKGNKMISDALKNAFYNQFGAKSSEQPISFKTRFDWDEALHDEKIVPWLLAVLRPQIAEEYKIKGLAAVSSVIPKTQRTMEEILAESKRVTASTTLSQGEKIKRQKELIDESHTARPSGQKSDAPSADLVSALLLKEKILNEMQRDGQAQFEAAVVKSNPELAQTFKRVRESEKPGILNDTLEQLCTLLKSNKSKDTELFLSDWKSYLNGGGGFKTGPTQKLPLSFANAFLRNGKTFREEAVNSKADARNRIFTDDKGNERQMKSVYPEEELDPMLSYWLEGFPNEPKVGNAECQAAIDLQVRAAFLNRVAQHLPLKSNVSEEQDLIQNQKLALDLALLRTSRNNLMTTVKMGLVECKSPDLAQTAIHILNLPQFKTNELKRELDREQAKVEKNPAHAQALKERFLASNLSFEKEGLKGKVCYPPYQQDPRFFLSPDSLVLGSALSPLLSHLDSKLSSIEPKSPLDKSLIEYLKVRDHSQDKQTLPLSKYLENPTAEAAAQIDWAGSLYDSKEFSANFSKMIGSNLLSSINTALTASNGKGFGMITSALQTDPLAKIFLMREWLLKKTENAHQKSFEEHAERSKMSEPMKRSEERALKQLRVGLCDNSPLLVQDEKKKTDPRDFPQPESYLRATNALAKTGQLQLFKNSPVYLSERFYDKFSHLSPPAKERFLKLLESNVACLNSHASESLKKDWLNHFENDFAKAERTQAELLWFSEADRLASACGLFQAAKERGISLTAQESESIRKARSTTLSEINSILAAASKSTSVNPKLKLAVNSEGQPELMYQDEKETLPLKSVVKNAFGIVESSAEGMTAFLYLEDLKNDKALHELLNDKDLKHEKVLSLLNRTASGFQALNTFLANRAISIDWKNALNLVNKRAESLQDLSLKKFHQGDEKTQGLNKALQKVWGLNDQFTAQAAKHITPGTEYTESPSVRAGSKIRVKFPKEYTWMSAGANSGGVFFEQSTRVLRQTEFVIDKIKPGQHFVDALLDAHLQDCKLSDAFKKSGWSGVDGFNNTFLTAREFERPDFRDDWLCLVMHCRDSKPFANENAVELADACRKKATDKVYTHMKEAIFRDKRSTFEVLDESNGNIPYENRTVDKLNPNKDHDVLSFLGATLGEFDPAKKKWIQKSYETQAASAESAKKRKTALRDYLIHEMQNLRWGDPGIDSETWWKNFDEKKRILSALQAKTEPPELVEAVREATGFLLLALPNEHPSNVLAREASRPTHLDKIYDPSKLNDQDKKLAAEIIKMLPHASPKWQLEQKAIGNSLKPGQAHPSLHEVLISLHDDASKNKMKVHGVIDSDLLASKRLPVDTKDMSLTHQKFLKKEMEALSKAMASENPRREFQKHSPDCEEIEKEFWGQEEIAGSALTLQRMHLTLNRQAAILSDFLDAKENPPKEIFLFSSLSKALATEIVPSGKEGIDKVSTANMNKQKVELMLEGIGTHLEKLRACIIHSAGRDVVASDISAFVKELAGADFELIREKQSLKKRPGAGALAYLNEPYLAFNRNTACSKIQMDTVTTAPARFSKYPEKSAQGVEMPDGTMMRNWFIDRSGNKRETGPLVRKRCDVEGDLKEIDSKTASAYGSKDPLVLHEEKLQMLERQTMHDLYRKSQECAELQLRTTYPYLADTIYYHEQPGVNHGSGLNSDWDEKEANAGKKAKEYEKLAKDCQQELAVMNREAQKYTPYVGMMSASREAHLNLPPYLRDIGDHLASNFEIKRPSTNPDEKLKAAENAKYVKEREQLKDIIHNPRPGAMLSFLAFAQEGKLCNSYQKQLKDNSKRYPDRKSATGAVAAIFGKVEDPAFNFCDALKTREQRLAMKTQFQKMLVDLYVDSQDPILAKMKSWPASYWSKSPPDPELQNLRIELMKKVEQELKEANSKDFIALSATERAKQLALMMINAAESGGEFGENNEKLTALESVEKESQRGGILRLSPTFTAAMAALEASSMVKKDPAVTPPALQLLEEVKKQTPSVAGLSTHETNRVLETDPKLAQAAVALLKEIEAGGKGGPKGELHQVLIKHLPHLNEKLPPELTTALLVHYKQDEDPIKPIKEKAEKEYQDLLTKVENRKTNTLTPEEKNILKLIAKKLFDTDQVDSEGFQRAMTAEESKRYEARALLSLKKQAADRLLETGLLKLSGEKREQAIGNVAREAELRFLHTKLAQIDELLENPKATPQDKKLLEGDKANLTKRLKIAVLDSVDAKTAVDAAIATFRSAKSGLASRDLSQLEILQKLSIALGESQSPAGQKQDDATLALIRDIIDRQIGIGGEQFSFPSEHLEKMPFTKLTDLSIENELRELNEKSPLRGTPYYNNHSAVRVRSALFGNLSHIEATLHGGFDKNKARVEVKPASSDPLGAIVGSGATTKDVAANAKEAEDENKIIRKAFDLSALGEECEKWILARNAEEVHALINPKQSEEDLKAAAELIQSQKELSELNTEVDSTIQELNVTLHKQNSLLLSLERSKRVTDKNDQFHLDKKVKADLEASLAEMNREIAGLRERIEKGKQTYNSKKNDLKNLSELALKKKAARDESALKPGSGGIAGLLDGKKKKPADEMCLDNSLIRDFGFAGMESSRDYKNETFQTLERQRRAKYLSWLNALKLHPPETDKERKDAFDYARDPKNRFAVSDDKLLRTIEEMAQIGKRQKNLLVNDKALLAKFGLKPVDPSERPDLTQIKLKIEGNDLLKDCFHVSPEGHEKGCSEKDMAKRLEVLAPALLSLSESERANPKPYAGFPFKILKQQIIDMWSAGGMRKFVKVNDNLIAKVILDKNNKDYVLEFFDAKGLESHANALAKEAKEIQEKEKDLFLDIRSANNHSLAYEGYEWIRKQFGDPSHVQKARQAAGESLANLDRLALRLQALDGVDVELEGSPEDARAKGLELALDRKMGIRTDLTETLKLSEEQQDAKTRDAVILVGSTVAGCVLTGGIGCLTAGVLFRGAMVKTLGRVVGKEAALSVANAMTAGVAVKLGKVGAQIGHAAGTFKMMYYLEQGRFLVNDIFYEGGYGFYDKNQDWKTSAEQTLTTSTLFSGGHLAATGALKLANLRVFATQVSNAGLKLKDVGSALNEYKLLVNSGAKTVGTNAERVLLQATGAGKSAGVLKPVDLIAKVEGNLSLVPLKFWQAPISQLMTALPKLTTSMTQYVGNVGGHLLLDYQKKTELDQAFNFEKDLAHTMASEISTSLFLLGGDAFVAGLVRSFLGKVALTGAVNFSIGRIGKRIEDYFVEKDYQEALKRANALPDGKEKTDAFNSLIEGYRHGLEEKEKLATGELIQSLFTDVAVFGGMSSKASWTSEANLRASSSLKRGVPVSKVLERFTTFARSNLPTPPAHVPMPAGLEHIVSKPGGDLLRDMKVVKDAKGASSQEAAQGLKIIFDQMAHEYLKNKGVKLHPETIERFLDSYLKDFPPGSKVTFAEYVERSVLNSTPPEFEYISKHPGGGGLLSELKKIRDKRGEGSKEAKEFLDKMLAHMRTQYATAGHEFSPQTLEKILEEYTHEHSSKSKATFAEFVEKTYNKARVDLANQSIERLNGTTSNSRLDNATRDRQRNELLSHWKTVLENLDYNDPVQLARLSELPSELLAMPLSQNTAKNSGLNTRQALAKIMSQLHGTDITDAERFLEVYLPLHESTKTKTKNGSGVRTANDLLTQFALSRPESPLAAAEWVEKNMPLDRYLQIYGKDKAAQDVVAAMVYPLLYDKGYARDKDQLETYIKMHWNQIRQPGMTAKRIAEDALKSQKEQARRGITVEQVREAKPDLAQLETMDMNNEAQRENLSKIPSALLATASVDKANSNGKTPRQAFAKALADYHGVTPSVTEAFLDVYLPINGAAKAKPGETHTAADVQKEFARSLPTSPTALEWIETNKVPINKYIEIHGQYTGAPKLVLEMVLPLLPKNITPERASIYIFTHWEEFLKPGTTPKSIVNAMIKGESKR